MKSNFFPKDFCPFFNFFFTVFATMIVSFAYANNTTYYIDNISGNNSNNGTSSGSAWNDFTNINSLTLQQGDHLLLKRGCTWNQELHLAGSGTSSNFIVIDAYGSGNKPKIQRNSQANDRTVFISNSSYLIFQNLEVCNAGDGIRLGYNIAKGNTSVYFQDLYIHNINNVLNGSPSTTEGIYYSIGIWIYGDGFTKSTTVSDYVARDIHIVRCEFGYTTSPVSIGNVYTNPTGQTTENSNSFRNFLIDSNYIHDFSGPIGLRGINHSTFSNNNLVNGATGYASQGTCGIFNFAIDSLVFLNNVMDGIPNTGSPDQCWVDNEAYCNNTIFTGNTIKNSYGAGVELLSSGATSGPGGNPQPPRDADDFNTNNVFNNNTFYNNGNGSTYTGCILILVAPGAAVPSGSAANNFYKSGNIFLNGTTTNFALSNNNISLPNSVNLALNKVAASSSIWDASQTAAKAFDGNSSTDWQSSASGTFANQWLRADLGTGTTFDSVRISEYGNRTSSFRMEYSDDTTSWQTAYFGTTIGSGSSFIFSPVTARYVRIYFVSGSATPIIYEAAIYNRSNIAMSASPIASCTDTANGYSVFKAINGNINSFDGWACNVGSTFDLTWGNPKTFDSIVVFTTSGYVLKDYDLQYWNGASYTLIAAVRNNNLTAKTNYFPPVTTTRLRVNSITGDIYNIARIDEIRVYSKALINVPTASASCTDFANGYSPQRAINGNTADFDGWACNTTAWFELTWPSSKTFNQVDLYTTTGYCLKDYDLQAWNGSSYTLLAQIRNNLQKYVSTSLSQPATTTKLRVNCITGDIYNIARIDEIKIFNNGSFVRRSNQTPPITTLQQEIEKSKIHVYPNPANKSTLIDWQGIDRANASINIYDIGGRLIKTIQVKEDKGQYNLNTSAMKPGLYFLRMISLKKKFMQKLIVVH